MVIQNIPLSARTSLITTTRPVAGEGRGGRGGGVEGTGEGKKGEGGDKEGRRYMVQWGTYVPTHSALGISAQHTVHWGYPPTYGALGVPTNTQCTGGTHQHTVHWGHLTNTVN